MNISSSSNVLQKQEYMPLEAKEKLKIIPSEIWNLILAYLSQMEISKAVYNIKVLRTLINHPNAKAVFTVFKYRLFPIRLSQIKLPPPYSKLLRQAWFINNYFDDVTQSTNKVPFSAISLKRRHSELNELKKCMLNDELIEMFKTNFPNLTSIDLRQIINITDLDVIRIVVNYPKIKMIDLSECKDLTDEVVTWLINSCPDLTTIKCNNITDDAINMLVIKYSKQLNTIDLSSCSRITDETVKKLPASCPNLISINLPAQMKEETIKFLAASCPNLTSIFMKNFDKITYTTLKELRVKFPKLEVRVLVKI
jgi:hypothetical protein